MANHMKEVAKLLGVELEEVFRLEKYESYFRFTREYFESSLDGNNWSIAHNLTLLAVLNGAATIKKLPWKPKYDEKYYIPSISNAFGYNKKESSNGQSYCYLETCAFAKKPKLRKAKPLTVYQKLKFARLGCLRWPSIWHHRNRPEHNTRSEDN